MSTIESNAFDILAISDTEFEDVTFPATGFGGWSGKTFRIRSISAGEREDLLRTSVTVSGKHRTIDSPVMRVKIVWLSVVDEAGNRVFRTTTQLQQLAQKSAAAIDVIADAALRLAAIGDESEKDAEDDDPKSPSSTPTSDSATS